jgi:hypothetical protein
MKTEPKYKELTDKQRKVVEKILKEEDVVLLGITASQVHESRGMPKWSSPVTLLAELPTMQKLIHEKDIEIEDGTEILPAYVDIEDENGDIFLRIHETAACHSYHQMANGVKVASIPTMLQFFFAYMFSGATKEELTHLMCVSQRLVDLAAHKEERRYAILTPMNCLGEQDTLIDLKKHKSELYEKLSKDKSNPDFIKYFFSYDPKMSETRKRKIREALKKTRKARIRDSY